MQYATETSRVADINLAKIIASRMEKNKNVRILDVCAGTGLLGVQVTDYKSIFHSTVCKKSNYTLTVNWFDNNSQGITSTQI